MLSLRVLVRVHVRVSVLCECLSGCAHCLKSAIYLLNCVFLVCPCVSSLHLSGVIRQASSRNHGKQQLSELSMVGSLRERGVIDAFATYACMHTHIIHTSLSQSVTRSLDLLSHHTGVQQQFKTQDLPPTFNHITSRHRCTTTICCPCLPWGSLASSH